DERDDREAREEFRLDVESLPEDVDVAERAEPQGVDVIGKRRAAAQDQQGDQAKQNVPAAPFRTPRRGPVGGGSSVGIRGAASLPVELESQLNLARRARGAIESRFVRDHRAAVM